MSYINNNINNINELHLHYSYIIFYHYHLYHHQHHLILITSTGHLWGVQQMNLTSIICPYPLVTYGSI